MPARHTHRVSVDVPGSKPKVSTYASEAQAKVAMDLAIYARALIGATVGEDGAAIPRFKTSEHYHAIACMRQGGRLMLPDLTVLTLEPIPPKNNDNTKGDS